MTLLLISMMALALQGEVPAPADHSSASAAPATEVAPVSVKGSRKVCVRQGSRVSVGSRIRDPEARVVCKTREEWKSDLDADKQDLQKIFADVPVILSPTGGPEPNCRGAGLC